MRQKLNAIGVEFKGRNVLLVDDSIVRGTTSKEIVQMAREAGANKVYMASAAPPVRFPNVYGIDMPTREELIAADRSIEQIRDYIGADALIYQDVDAMKRVVGALNPKLDGFEASCFDGRYVTGDISVEEFAAMESQRNAAGRRRRGRRRHSRLALQSATRSMPDGRSRRSCRAWPCRPTLRRDTLAVRDGAAAQPMGRELRGAVPDQQLRAARCRDRGARALPTRRRPSSTAASPTPR